MKTFNPFRFLASLVVATCVLAPSFAFAQEYKEAYNAGIEAAKARDYPAARNEFARAANLARQEGDAEIADRAARNAATIDYNLGNQLVKQESFDEALARFDAGIELYPRYSNNYLGKAVALKKLDRPDDAILAYQALIALGQEVNDSQAIRGGENGIRNHYIVLASAALGRRAEPSTSDAREAIGHLEQLVEHVEADADTYYYLGVANQALGNYQEAIDFADQALAIHRGSRTDAAKIHFVRGESLMYAGQTDAAKEAFRNSSFGNYKSLSEHYLETL